MLIKFALIGDGQVAKCHRKAIEHVGGEIVWIVDPKHEDRSIHSSRLPIDLEDWHHFYRKLIDTIDYFVIASPSQFHRPQIKYLLSNLNSDLKDFQIICEKPAFLPWEPVICDDRINIVLQLRYFPNLPDKAEKVVAHFVRDEAYFKSWKGDPKKTGGLFFNLYIHFLDLAIQLGADFEGSVNLPDDQLPKFWETDGPSRNHRRYIRYKRKNHPEYIKCGANEYSLGMMSLEDVDMQACYNSLYEDILSGGGIKPKDTFYLSWVLARNSELFGYGKDAMEKTIRIGKELL